MKKKSKNKMLERLKKRAQHLINVKGLSTVLGHFGRETLCRMLEGMINGKLLEQGIMGFGQHTLEGKGKSFVSLTSFYSKLFFIVYCAVY